jgi:DNA-binding LytR/AlgR family response regulator
MFTVLVVDDEEPAREELKYLLEQDEEVLLVGEASDGFEALDKYKELTPQVVFLDIQMPGLDGFDVAKALIKTDNPPIVIFATAYDIYAIKAFDHAALDYLLKPVSPLRLENTMQRIKSILANRQEKQWLVHLEKLFAGLNQDFKQSLNKGNKKQEKIERIPVCENEKIVLLQPEEIILLESRGRGTDIITESKAYFSNSSLTELEEKLNDYNFMRTHKSYIVNLNKIKEVVTWFNNTLVLHLAGSSIEVPVSRTYLKEFKQRIPL